MRPVLEDRTGRVWFGSEADGLFTLEGGKSVRVAAAGHGRTNWTVRVLHEDRAGRLWIGAEDGLIEKRGDQFVRYEQKDGLLGREVLGIRDAPDGSIWVGTKLGLQHLQDGHFRTVSAPEIGSSPGVNPLLVEADGTVWAASARGLVRIRGEGQIATVTERQGLHDNTPFCLLEDDAGNYWVNSVRGIFRIRKAALHAVADGREKRLYCVSYGEADGAGWPQAVLFVAV